MPADETRAALLRGLGLDDAVAAEVLAYTRNAFEPHPALAAGPWPLPDEPSVGAWRRYAEEAETVGAWRSLRRRLVQLRFPVEEGVSATPAYQAATRRGEWPPDDAPGVALERPEALELRIHPTAAGHIPVVVAATRADFVALVRALAHRNEPRPVPDAMGACIVGGFNNWSRVHDLRRAWEEEGGPARETWAEAFRALVPRRELYQDRFVVLSRGPYSAVPAGQVGLGAEEWAEVSLRIRLEHECAHYFTRRVLGSMRNTVHDELIADFMGITVATGRFRADWLLRFLGLEDFPRIRETGRLHTYRGSPPLSDRAFVAVAELIVRAVEALEQADRQAPAEPASLAWRAGAMLQMAHKTLEELALIHPLKQSVRFRKKFAFDLPAPSPLP